VPAERGLIVQSRDFESGQHGRRAARGGHLPLYQQHGFGCSEWLGYGLSYCL
jgi:hypothetical protein